MSGPAGVLWGLILPEEEESPDSPSQIDSNLACLSCSVCFSRLPQGFQLKQIDDPAPAGCVLQPAMCLKLDRDSYLAG